MTHRTLNIGIVSLGCPKNQVDAEQMLGVLTAAGHHIVSDQQDADVIVVNTCGFIESAKEESIAAVLDAAKQKGRGRCKRLVVAGCLAQRYGKELFHEVPEADAVIGTTEIGRIASICEGAPGRDRTLAVASPGLVAGLPRVSSTPAHSRYLKIGDGCSNRCSFCAIPIIRGPFRSRPRTAILDEARRLAQEGARELVLLAQDSTAYRDRGQGLPHLLRSLARVRGIAWVRLMYVYPGRVDDELLAVLAEEAKICRYLDMPIQHIDDAVLRAMHRRGTSDDIRRTVERLRKRVPGIALRTSLITGFPGETEAAFRRLLAFVKEAEFDHLGVFAYSAEEGTAAANLPHQVPHRIAEERLSRIMRAQAAIVKRRNRRLVGSQQRVLVDGLEDLVLRGRLETQAPEIDGVVYLSETDAAPGTFIEVTITDAAGYDLMGTASPSAAAKQGPGPRTARGTKTGAAQGKAGTPRRGQRRTH